MGEAWDRGGGRTALVDIGGLAVAVVGGGGGEVVGSVGREMGCVLGDWLAVCLAFGGSVGGWFVCLFVRVDDIEERSGFAQIRRGV